MNPRTAIKDAAYVTVGMALIGARKTQLAASQLRAKERPDSEAIKQTVAIGVAAAKEATTQQIVDIRASASGQATAAKEATIIHLNEARDVAATQLADARVKAAGLAKRADAQIEPIGTSVDSALIALGEKLPDSAKTAVTAGRTVVAVGTGVAGTAMQAVNTKLGTDADMPIADVDIDITGDDSATA